ncbi:MAG: hypothetical protein WC779_08320 [Candidatus Omnitrophota bacterium]
MVKALISKRIIFLSFVAAVLFLGITAAEEPVDKAAKAAEEKEAKERALAQEKMRKLVQDAKGKINNTTWQIDLRESMSAAGEGKGAKGKKAESLDKDTITFKDNKIESSSLISNGFTPTNYTVRLKGKNNDIIIWETMQTSAEKGVAFWRGEIDNDVMRGVLSWQVDEKNKQDYSFTSAQKSIQTSAAAPAAPETAVAVTANPPVPEVAAPVIQEAAPATEEVKAAAPKSEEPKAAAKEAAPKKKGFAW